MPYPFANKTLQDIRERSFRSFDKNDNHIKWQNNKSIQDMQILLTFSSKL